MSAVLWFIGVPAAAVLVAWAIARRATRIADRFADYPSENGDGED